MSGRPNHRDMLVRLLSVLETEALTELWEKFPPDVLEWWEFRPEAKAAETARDMAVLRERIAGLQDELRVASEPYVDNVELYISLLQKGLPRGQCARQIVADKQAEKDAQADRLRARIAEYERMLAALAARYGSTRPDDH